jgi:hypothetical protein
MPINLEAIWAGDRQAIRLAMGELTPQEMRTVLALLNMLRPEREEIKKKLRAYALELFSIHEEQLLNDMEEYDRQKGHRNDAGAKGSDVRDITEPRGSVGPSAPDYSQQQPHGAADENNVGARGAS